MKTSVIEIGDMLSVLSVPGVEKRIGEVLGVESVTVDFAARSATVRYDETRLTVADIKSNVRQSGYESAAEPTAPVGGGHESHVSPGAPPASPAPAARKPAPDPAPDPAPSTPAGEAHAGDVQQEKKMGPDGVASPVASGAQKSPPTSPSATATSAADGPSNKTAPAKG